MPDIKCAKCGETLKEDALSCWACGTLTPAGLRARGEGDDEETWRQSVQAARQRHAQAPPVDPDAALQRVLAQAGAEAPPTRRPEPTHDLRLDERKLASSAETIASLGALLGFLTVLGGIIAMVVGILAGEALAMLTGVAAFVFIGGLALAIFFQSRFLADMGRSLADALHELRSVRNALWDLQHGRREGGGER